MMTDKYYPRGEIKKLEIEMWNLKVKGTDVSDKIKNYVCGLPDMIYGSVISSKPKTMQDAIEFATELMDKKISTLEGVCWNSTVVQQVQVSSQWPVHYKGANSRRLGHLTRDCKSPAATNNQRYLTCYECGNQGHYRSDCPESKNQNHGNQAEGTEAWGMVHTLGGGETNQDLNDLEDDINA
ncbi:hypothetical protein Tco_0473991 [Tanacetum coccineum]